MRRFAAMAAAVLMLAGSVGLAAQDRQATVEVYKSPTCGCCSKWVDHLRSHGFTVRTTDTEAVDELKLVAFVIAHLVGGSPGRHVMS